MDAKAALQRKILSKLTPPRIGSNRLEAVPDADYLQTVQLQAAIDVLSAAGGGVLVFPAGIYRTGALHLKSGVELHLASPETRVQFTPDDPEKNYPLVLSHWEASPCYNYSALLYVRNAHDIAVTGCGTLDGGADKDHWWNWHHQVEDSWPEDKPDFQPEPDLRFAAQDQRPARLCCRGMLKTPVVEAPEQPITYYKELAEMLVPLCDTAVPVKVVPGCTQAVCRALEKRVLPAGTRHL